MGLRCVIARSADLTCDLVDDLVALTNDTMGALYARSGRSIGWDVTRQRAEILHPDAGAICLFKEDDLKGYCLLRSYHEEGLNLFYIQELHLAPDMQRKGIGGALIRQLARHASGQGYDRLRLTNLDVNLGAAAFYRAIGLEPVSGRFGIYQTEFEIDLGQLNPQASAAPLRDDISTNAG